MIVDEGLRRLHDRLASTQLPMFIGGAVAAMWYGEPRSTLDIDIVLAAAPADAERLIAVFPPDAFYVPPLGVLREELARRQDGQFNVIDLVSGLKADIYVAGEDPLVAYGFAHAVDCELAGQRLRFAPATYVIAMKLRFFAMSNQDKHLRDIRSILTLSPEAVDTAEVTRWADRFGVIHDWRRCQARPGEESPER